MLMTLMNGECHTTLSLCRAAANVYIPYAWLHAVNEPMDVWMDLYQYCNIKTGSSLLLLHYRL